MRYYLDCEFNGLGGELISLALVSESNPGADVYLANDKFKMPNPRMTGAAAIDPWVAENVLPLVEDQTFAPLWCPLSHWPAHIETLLRKDRNVTIITDWPDDIKYFCELILTGPGTMIEVRPSIKFEMHRVDAYPTTLPGAIQHCAIWDAYALRRKLAEAQQ